jgi:hypothetical protein
MLEYQLVGRNSGTYSLVNNNLAIWSATPSTGSVGVGFSSPQWIPISNPQFVKGMHVGSASVTGFIQNELALFGGSVCYNSQENNVFNIDRGRNYYLTTTSANATINLPNSPVLGDYLWYENHNGVNVRFTLTISGNGNSIRSATNSIRTSINDIQGLFHWDGTYWNHIYDA